jgi:hypothetical protein
MKTNLLSAKRYIATAILIILHFFFVGTTLVRSQGASWSMPIEFFAVGQDGHAQTPELVTDSGGNLHAFWRAALTGEDPVALYHSQWDGTRWSAPVDVLVSPGGASIWAIELFLDQDDNIHAFWQAQNGIWHSKAHVARIDSASYWSSAQLISTSEVPSPNVAVAQDDNGVFHIAYVNEDLSVVRVLQSSDNFETWSLEALVYSHMQTEIAIAEPGSLIAPNGDLWLWVAEKDRDRIGVGYMGMLLFHSEDGGRTWSEPERVVDGYYTGDFQVIDGIVVQLIAGGIGTGGRYISFSYDSGVTWTEPVDISLGYGDGLQRVEFVVDSSGIWHFAEQTGNTFAATSWDGEYWFPVEFIVPREVLENCCVTPGVTTQNVNVGLSGGNHLHAFFNQAARTIWYTERILPASYVAPQPVPVPSVVAETSNDFDQPTREVQVTRVPTLSPTVETPSTQEVISHPWFPVLVGGLSALSIIAFVFLRQIRRGRS